MLSITLKDLYQPLPLCEGFRPEPGNRYHLTGLAGSFRSFLAAELSERIITHQVFILNDKEEAAYFFNDLENLFGQETLDFREKTVLFFPTSYKKPYDTEAVDNANVLSRSEVITRLSSGETPLLIVTYPEALCEKVVTKSYLEQAIFKINRDEKISLDFLTDILSEYGFERSDFVIEAGQYSIRGGLVDVFSYADDYPYRIEFDGDEVGSIRTFDPATQLSKETLKQVSILPDIHDRSINETRQSFLDLFGTSCPVWLMDTAYMLDKTEKEFDKVQKAYLNLRSAISHLPPEQLFCTSEELLRIIQQHPVIEFGLHFYFKEA
ncbi:MAG: transcription-repair coupling factor, partial [Bacteroidetes bacterium]|nr:transcription-repair coupling factor [Bacteroidota bacterium]